MRGGALSAGWGMLIPPGVLGILMASQLHPPRNGVSPEVASDVFIPCSELQFRALGVVRWLRDFGGTSGTLSWHLRRRDLRSLEDCTCRFWVSGETAFVGSREDGAARRSGAAAVTVSRCRHRKPGVRGLKQD